MKGGDRIFKCSHIFWICWGGEIKVIHTDAGEVLKLWKDGVLPFRSMKKTLFPPADYVAWNPLMAHQNMWTAEDLAKDFFPLKFSSFPTSKIFNFGLTCL